MPELAMTRADYQDLCAHIPIFRATIVISVSMYRPALFNESLLTHSSFQLLLATIRTSMPSQMARRLLQENDTALSALYPYWLMGVDIFHFRIVILVAMYFFRLFNELLCCFLWCTVTSRTARSTHMIIGSYPEFAMFRANNTDFFFIVNIFNF